MSARPYKLQEKPLTKEQLKELADPSGWVDDIIVPIALNDIIDADIEGFNDLICEAVGSPLMQNISYHVMGHDDNVLHIEVHGDVSLDIEEDEDEHEEDK
jgi:hypothetical protein